MCLRSHSNHGITMKKEIINPDAGNWADHETAYSDGVVVHHNDHWRIFLSGVVSDGDSIEEQTRGVLEEIESTLADTDGGIQDIVRVRIYVRESHLTAENIETIHEVRNEFFVRGHYPASTLVEVQGFVTEAFDIEIDAEAIVPDDEWETESIE